ncbi:MAG: shikimate kinase [Planctomycetes bacterium]|nr:shikimate kinase [Planctomycetota bacterium]
MRVVLIGLRGSGKSTVGRELAACLRLPFRDSDLELTARWGETPAEVLARHGEVELRLRETRTIRELARETHAVLALGGGSPARAENRKCLAEWRAILLDAPVAELARRIVADAANERPPLTELPILEEIERHRRERWPDYLRMKPLVCDTSRSTPHDLAQSLAERLLGEDESAS